MNEEDIKILEDLLNRLKYNISLGVVNEWKPNEIFADALENLINRNKELEEFIIKYYDEIRKEYEGLINHKFIDYIPKSKIKEKIEELDKEEQELQDSISDEEREEYSDASISWSLCDIETRRRCYKELLQEGENNGN